MAKVNMCDKFFYEKEIHFSSIIYKNFVDICGSELVRIEYQAQYKKIVPAEFLVYPTRTNRLARVAIAC
ncbi:hypothetical protein KSZ_54210 [Dictyobacter formicarum]|uniref:Uncharacterized protein n=1 Tax=Dictyobacter formicarum TaxID=2778368 RepID=A0ABQ3VMW8_9CHLR|nr:hypothetical protein KSZ_54210 [Dictyobacter formicarum]